MNQLKYSEFVAEILNNNSKLQVGLAETEFDSRDGYLTAAAKVIDENPSERILVTLANKNLQKALPSLSSKVRPAVLKERFSYICLRKFYNCINNADLYLTVEERINFFALITWIEKNKDGDLNEVLHYNRAPVLWKKVACEAGSCLGAQCEHFSKCHFQNAKKNAENSNLLLVSHRLFLQDLHMDFAILPSYAKIIFDDAHRLSLESQKNFGRHLIFYTLRNATKQNSWCKKWEEQSAECEKLFLNLIKEIQNYAQKTKKRRIVYSKNLSSETGISSELLQSALRKLLEIIETVEGKDSMQFASDIRKISSDIAFLFAASRSDLVYWVECSSNPYQVIFNAEPVNPSVKWSKSLYPILKSAFFTSNAISINGQFEYLIHRLALHGKNIKSQIFSNDTDEGVSIPEVFAADFLPKPTDESFNAELLKVLCEILQKNETNTLIFSDFGVIQKLNAEIKKLESQKKCFFQGMDGNYFNLISFFQKEAGSALMGAPDELKNLEDMELPENSLIVLSRLPFPDIKEPVASKRMDILKEQNKNSFNIITMPETILTLRRIYSAILRSGKKQTLLFLDSRITNEPYGAKIQKIFPNFKSLSHRVFSTGFFSNEM
ncbi:MAG: hypothetical protein LBU89_04980 [Fibromonadaceae bacterium]|jgi:Rad3-related DNA helicase|nr:hypothetical protein [Fibromonadaceae bacterium]